VDRAAFKERRLAQLRTGGFALWVYRAHDPISCPESHAAFDGVVLPPDHPFWERWRPPHRGRCGCSVAGARHERGAQRLGGDPDKALPTWWETVDPNDGEGAFD
jgi:uncharacterized protein with gpF-like domain